MIVADAISYRAAQQDILIDVSASFGAGKLNAVLGPNGAGKSTLVGCLAGSIRPTGGVIEIDGRSLGDYSRLELARRRAVLSQSIAVNFPFSAMEIVLMGRNPYALAGSTREDEAAAEETLRAMDAWPLRDRLVPSLSGGERQRVHLARALAQIWTREKAYLLLDEPTSALDLKHQYQTFSLLRRLCSERSLCVVVVMHDLTLAHGFTDHAHFMKEGRVVCDGQSQDVINPTNIGEIYELPAEYTARVIRVGE